MPEHSLALSNACIRSTVAACHPRHRTKTRRTKQTIGRPTLLLQVGVQHIPPLYSSLRVFASHQIVSLVLIACCSPEPVHQLLSYLTLLSYPRLIDFPQRPGLRQSGRHSRYTAAPRDSSTRRTCSVIVHTKSAAKSPLDAILAERRPDSTVGTTTSSQHRVRESFARLLPDPVIWARPSSVQSSNGTNRTVLPATRC